MDQCSMVTLNLTFGDKCIKTDAVDQLLLSEGVCRQFNPVSSSSRTMGSRRQDLCQPPQGPAKIQAS